MPASSTVTAKAARSAACRSGRARFIGCSNTLSVKAGLWQVALSKSFSASRQTADAAVRLDHDQDLRRKDWHSKCFAAHAASQLCDPPAATRRRLAFGPGAAWPQRYFDDANLYAHYRSAPAHGLRQSSSARARRRRQQRAKKIGRGLTRITNLKRRFPVFQFLCSI